MTQPVYGHSPHPPGTMFGYDLTTEQYVVLAVSSLGALSTSGGGEVTWPLAITLLTVDPAPQVGKVLFYALTDGVASPNNVITLKYLFPDGTQIIQQVMTV